MDIAYHVFHFYKRGRSPIDDRLLYEIFAEDRAAAEKRLCQLMGWARMPKGLDVRIALVTLDVS